MGLDYEVSGSTVFIGNGWVAYFDPDTYILVRGWQPILCSSSTTPRSSFLSASTHPHCFPTFRGKDGGGGVIDSFNFPFYSSLDMRVLCLIYSFFI